MYRYIKNPYNFLRYCIVVTARQDLPDTIDYQKLENNNNCVVKFCVQSRNILKTEEFLGLHVGNLTKIQLRGSLCWDWFAVRQKPV